MVFYTDHTKENRKYITETDVQDKGTRTNLIMDILDLIEVLKVMGNTRNLILK